MFPRLLLAGAFCGALAFSAHAQNALSGALTQTAAITSSTASAPNSAWIDLRQSVAAPSRTQSAPTWVQAVTVAPAAAGKTVFRIRVAKPAPEYSILFFRLFFEDKPETQPEIVVWDESGTQILRSSPLGSGIGLPSSDSLLIPLIGLSAIDVEVPGDGSTVRSAFLDWMGQTEVLHPVNAEHRDLIPEPFGASPPLRAPTDDREVFGTVTATLSSETIKIGASVPEGAAFEFPLEAQPLVALLTFEVASPAIENPPEVYVNGENLGPVTLALPDLADPAFRGTVKPLLRDMHFQYTGWLRAQKLVPAANLKTGTNNVMVTGAAGSPPSAIRSTEIQLKYLWDKSDYLLQPEH